MLIDFENTGYIKICPHPMVEEQCTYIPASTWGFIRGDIKEQSDLISLLTTIESGLTPEQIKLLVDTDSRFEDVEKSVIELDAKNTNEYVEINLMLDTKADAADVYTKTEIDNKGYLTEHQSLDNYYTKGEADNNFMDKSEFDTEVEKIVEACGKDFVTVCPGIRPANASVGDQKRVVTPKDAINKGAHYLVVGRPITKAENPSQAANDIVKEIENI